MSEKRRAEIEAKKAKLAELRRIREERQRADTERRNSEVFTHTYTLGRVSKADKMWFSRELSKHRPLVG